MSPERMEVMRALIPTVERLLPLVRSVDDCWQPSELLPDLSKEGWKEEVDELRAEAGRLTDEMLVVLVGNIVTEEALPSYQTALNRFSGIADRTGVDDHAWARWTRSWTAEEKRHGDVTRAYLFLSGRVELKSFERTIQHLLRNGFDTRAEGDPYRGLAYASFQEHATKVAWYQLGKIAGGVGASRLHKICGLVAADEARHERIYVAILDQVLKLDPSAAVEALDETLSHSIVMPARTMTDGHDRRLFDHFADVGQRIGVYTLMDYAANLRQLIETLGLAGLGGLTGTASQARDAILGLPERFEALAAEQSRRPARPVAFRWIHGRKA